MNTTPEETKLTTHTPGPWKIRRIDSQGHLVYHLIGPNSDKRLQGVAYAGVYGKKLSGHTVDIRQSDKECEANARLITAAPELLAALNRALPWLTSYPGNGAMGAYEQARVAIAKAEGRE